MVVHVSSWIYLAVVIVYLSLLAYGSIFVQSQFYTKTLCEGKTGKKEIAVTFDDGPLKQMTPAILEVLKEHNVKGAFFCIGNRIEENDEILKMIDKEDHIIANHSYSHSNFFDFYSTKSVMNELVKTAGLIHKISGRKSLFFRPPFGVTNPMVAKAAQMLNLKVIGWNIRSMDGAIKSEEKIFNNVISNLKPGAVILFHDSNPNLPAILRKFFLYCTEHGYSCVRLDELLNTPAYA